MKKLILISLIGISLAGCQNQPTSTAQTQSQGSQNKPTYLNNTMNTNIGGDFASSQTDASHKVLVIGDSISIGYSPFVKNLIAPFNYTLVNIKDSSGEVDNARNSWWFEKNVGAYLSQAPDADIILFNVGIWNTIYTDKFIAINGGDPNDFGTTDAQYQSDLISIAQQLKATGKRVIFVLSTDCLVNADEDVTRIPGLNAIAKSVLPSLGVEVYDIYTISTKLKNHHAGSNHFDDAGNAILAGLIANAIMGGI